jgi:hypothetical protein
MNEVSYTSTRVSVVCAMHAASPLLVTPARYSVVPTVTNPGPPESPSHGNEGPGTRPMVVDVTPETDALPLRFTLPPPSPDEPKPATRIVEPAAMESLDDGNMGTGAALTSDARTTSARSLASVEGSNWGCTSAADRATTVPPPGGELPKYAWYWVNVVSSMPQCAAVRTTCGEMSVPLHTTVFDSTSATTAGSPSSLAAFVTASEVTPVRGALGEHAMNAARPTETTARLGTMECYSVPRQHAPRAFRTRTSRREGYPAPTMRPCTILASGLLLSLAAPGCGSGPTVAAPTNVDVPPAGSSSTSSAPAPSSAAVADAPPADPTAPQTRADGLQITVLKPGSGPKSKPGDRLRVEYVGTLADGSEFDSSRKPGRKPFEFELGRGHVIKGWEEGMVGMQVGELRKLVIPPELAYGETGRPGIPGHSTLTFEVELLAIQ